MKRLFACTLLLFAAAPTFAADANGYTAKYECRAGGQYCNVDVVALGNRSCDQTIAASTPWSSINWSNNTICLEAGDHTGKGTLTIPSSANGNAGNYKVLRYSRKPGDNDNDDEPWKQGSNQAKLKAITFSASSYWIVHRITVDGNNGTTIGIMFGTGANYNIVNRSLVQNINSNLVASSQGAPSSDHNSIQNSVIRSAVATLSSGAGSVGAENQCIEFNVATNFRIVNNEVYDCNKMFSAGDSIEGTTGGTVIENNDLYVSPAYYTDCNGNYNGTGPCSVSEVISVLKTGGTQTNPVQVIHNRFYGGKTGDGVILGGNGLGGGGCLNISANPGQGLASWILVKDNICMDSVYGFGGYWGADHHISYIGNLLYNMHSENPAFSYLAGGILLSAKHNSEVYLNTVIAADVTWMDISGSDYRGGFDENNDTRCNVIIDSPVATGSLGTGSQRDYNIYYGTPDSSEANKTANTIATRANATNYSLGSIVRTAAASSCVKGTESACFLYKVTQAGTSSSTAPSYCTTLGCTVSDGGMTVQAIRGPYAYLRKLRTVPNGELAVIPYARAHASATEMKCPNTTGSRSNIGVNDSPLF